MVVVHEHLDGRMSIRYGPHLIAQYNKQELPPKAPKRRGTPRLPGARRRLKRVRTRLRIVEPIVREDGEPVQA